MKKPFEYTELKNFIEKHIESSKKNRMLALGEGLNDDARGLLGEVEALTTVLGKLNDMERRGEESKGLIPR